MRHSGRNQLHSYHYHARERLWCTYFSFCQLSPTAPASEFPILGYESCDPQSDRLTILLNHYP